MPVSFGKIQVGQTYTRVNLAKIWGYKSHAAISRGVITPRDTNYVILFVTKLKQKSLTQYNDFIDGEYLVWEGELKHGSDKRIINARKNQDHIHLFYRDIHHSPFIYKGEVFLLDAQQKHDKPSEFIFTINKKQVIGNDVFQDIKYAENQFIDLTETERLEIIKSRVGQGRFRNDLIKYWGGCAVTSVTNLPLLNASHIKPWSHSNNSERLNPNNGILLIPNYDQLFDRGLISFKNNSEIIISSKLNKEDQNALTISSKICLRKISSEHHDFLEYHRDCILQT
jgi:putative restriction endonuclease